MVSAPPGAGTEGLVWERLAATVLGAVIGVLASLVVLNRRAVRHLEEAVAECERACAHLEKVRGQGARTGRNSQGGQGAGGAHSEREGAVARHRLGRALMAVEESAAVVAGELAGVVPEQVGRVRERAQALMEGAPHRATKGERRVRLR